MGIGFDTMGVMEWQDIIERAVKTAVKKYSGGVVEVSVDEDGVGVEVLSKGGSLHEFLEYKDYYSIIFDHNFAKAFWGERCRDEKGSESHEPYDFMCVPEWAEHVQRMALYKQPLDYLTKFL